MEKETFDVKVSIHRGMYWSHTVITPDACTLCVIAHISVSYGNKNDLLGPGGGGLISRCVVGLLCYI